MSLQGADVLIRGSVRSRSRQWLTASHSSTTTHTAKRSRRRRAWRCLPNRDVDGHPAAAITEALDWRGTYRERSSSFFARQISIDPNRSPAERSGCDR